MRIAIVDDLAGDRALLRERLEKEKPKTMENLSRMIDELSSALAEECRKQAGTVEDAENGDRDK